MSKLLPIGTRVRLSAFWGVYADPQTARVVEVIPARVVDGIMVPTLLKVEPPLDGSEWWQPRDLQKVRA